MNLLALYYVVTMEDTPIYHSVVGKTCRESYYSIRRIDKILIVHKGAM